MQQAEEGQEEEFQRAFTLELCGRASRSRSLIAAAGAGASRWSYGDDRLLALTLAVSYLPIAFALQAPQWIFFRRMDFLRLRLLHALVPAVTFW